MIELTVNGKPRIIERPLSLLDYIGQLGINPQIIAVEHNGEIVRRDQYAETQLRAGDVVEIVRMVGGGAAFPACRSERSKEPPNTAPSPPC